MATIKIPYFRWREGRPRWEPGGEGGRRLAAGGFKAEDLKDGGGQWLGLEAAIARASELNAAVAAWRLGGAPRRRPQRPRESATSCRALWGLYRESPRWRRLATSTRADYARKGEIWLDTFGASDVAALRHHHLYQWWQEMHAARGHAMANSLVAVARLALSHAVRIGWLTVNPARTLGIDGVAPRCVVWTPAEIEALLAAADALGLPSVGDAIVIALHTGQRQGDVLALEAPQVRDARAYFRQAKRGARVAVPLTPQLEARLAEIQARRRSAGPVVMFPTERRLVLDAHGRPYTRERFGDDWREVRAHAATAHPEAAGKLFMDLRDTAITRLALAGCTVPEIRAITGHSMPTIHQVLQHYLALDDRMADAAIARLRQWMDEEGIAV
jgi:hypothetical protein